ncbi:hypothetical protein AWZ03_014241 [Drosophila navojoa]|uniref:Uncharacterized protein n=1 Tax=Drosophila navojoa TaxID=7232 RepID=A0A484ASI0_DRONA|nr:fizzy-related protein homolog [Drosophila navojoa]TDG39338.1 hypothetical protein AWZ03_014241 [Drosophila navojoa]
MFSPEFEKRILKHCSPVARNLFDNLESSTTPTSLDRFIPCRAHNNWQTSFASINKSNDNSPQTSKKQRDCGETARDSLAYSCLLKNELLGSAIDDVKTAGEERNENSYTPAAKRSLFKYQSPTKQVSSFPQHSHSPHPLKGLPLDTTCL